MRNAKVSTSKYSGVCTPACKLQVLNFKWNPQNLFIIDKFAVKSMKYNTATPHGH